MRTTTLRSITASLLCGAALSGCASLDDEYRKAVPTNQQITIAVPKAGGGTSGMSVGEEGVGVSAQALVGQISEYYQFTYGVSTVVNTSALALLGLLHAIVEQKPTSQTQSSRTWGPWTPGGLEPLTYRAVVTKSGPLDFTFSIDARPRASSQDADFLALLDGKITLAGLGAGGKGNMTLHFDNGRTLRPTQCERGTLKYTFDDTLPSASLDVTFTQFGNDNPKGLGCNNEMPHDATYHYERTTDGPGAGAGNFTFALATDIHKKSENKPQLEDVSIRSRWLASGAGRADVKVSGGEVTADLNAANLGVSSVILSQCWDTGFLTQYETSTPEQVHLVPTAGNPASCAFASQQLP